MLRSNSLSQVSKSVLTNINSITIDVILNLQKDLEPYDVVSMVFLLYDVPDTALQRLITYQRVYRDAGSNNLNLLYEWALYAQSKPTWRYEFLEALTICRLHNIIRQLGFNVSNVKEHYQPENVYVSVYIPSIKKVLYRLCENITSETLMKFKETLLSYDIDVTEHEYCEMIFLELLCRRFIVLINPNKEETSSLTDKRAQIESLARIIEKFHGLSHYANQLRDIEKKLNENVTVPVVSHYPSSTSTPSVVKTKMDAPKSNDKIYPEDLQEAFQLFNQLNIEDIPNIKNMKSDTLLMNDNIYPILNPKRIGICCIINQEKFHPSKNSIMSQEHSILTDRLGSRNDQIVLESTMTNLNFIVKVGCNLKYMEIFDFIKNCIRSSIPEDSMFVLCILSHGVRDHIFSADSMKIKVEDIQNLLDSDEAMHLRGKPKVMIMQACRVDDIPNNPKPRMVADSTSTSYYLRKSHFLVYWATAPEYEAFRDEKLGSIFVQTLCYIIKKMANKEQLSDICTTVTDYVTNFCTKKQYIQVPIFESTLRKKLFLCNPKPDHTKSS